MPSFRIIKGIDGREHAEFLVVVTFSNIQALSLGIWRRHSHFANLVHQVIINDSDALVVVIFA